MKNKTILGLMAFSIVAILGASLVAAGSFGNCMGGDLEFSEVDGEMQAFQESLQQSIENENFEDWENLMQSQLTQEKFNELVERHNQNSERQELMAQMQEAWDNEDYDTVKQLREQMQENMPEEPMNSGEEMPEGFRGHVGDFQHGGFFHRFQFWKR